MKPGSLKNLTEEDVQRLELLSRVGKKINTRESFAEAIQAVLDSVVESLEADRGAIFLSEGGELPTLRLSVDRTKDEGPFEFSKTVVERVWEQLEPLAVVDAKSSEAFASVDSIQVQGIRSLICVPLVGNRETLGLLYLDNRIQNAFTDSDLQMLDVISDLAATALERARVSEALQKLNDELEATVDARTQEAEQARIEAERATAAKSLFLANMSHELRTPLNGILGLTEDLLRSQRSPSMRMLLEQIGFSARSLSTLVNGILDFSKIESGQSELDEHDFLMEEILKSILASVAYTAQEKGLELVVDVGETVPARLEADSTRLKQILINLLANAVKFTESGWVRLSVDSPAENLLRFRVSDSGIGIPQEKLSVIFEPFSQGDASTTRQYGGTGLGLSICRSLTKLMGAELTVESEVGVGSHFAFTIPVNVLAEFSRPQLKGVRIYLEDPEPLHRGIVAGLLEKYGAECRPDKAGCELAIVGSDSEDPGIPYIVMATRQQMSHPDFAPAEHAQVLLRPVIRDELFVSIRQLRSGTVAVHPETAERPSPPQGSQILIADDNEINRLVLERMVTSWGYEVRMAGTGYEVVDEFDKSPPRLILMDIDMPGLDGYHAAQRIRAKEVLKGRKPLPILAVTAHLASDMRRRCVESGMDDLLPKPISRRILARRLSRWEAVLQGELPRRQARLLDHAEFKDWPGQLLTEIHGLLSTLTAMLGRGSGPAAKAALLRLQRLAFAADLLDWGGRLVLEVARGKLENIHKLVTDLEQEWKAVAPTLVTRPS